MFFWKILIVQINLKKMPENYFTVTSMSNLEDIVLFCRMLNKVLAVKSVYFLTFEVHFNPLFILIHRLIYHFSEISKKLLRMAKRLLRYTLRKRNSYGGF